MTDETIAEPVQSDRLLNQDEIDTLLGGPEWVEKREFDLLQFARRDVMSALYDVSPLPLADAVLAVIKVLERRAPTHPLTKDTETA